MGGISTQPRIQGSLDYTIRYSISGLCSLILFKQLLLLLPPSHTTCHQLEKIYKAPQYKELKIFFSNWGCRPLVDILPSMLKAQHSIPSNAKPNLKYFVFECLISINIMRSVLHCSNDADRSRRPTSEIALRG